MNEIRSLYFEDSLDIQKFVIAGNAKMLGAKRINSVIRLDYLWDATQPSENVIVELITRNVRDDLPAGEWDLIATTSDSDYIFANKAGTVNKVETKPHIHL